MHTVFKPSDSPALTFGSLFENLAKSLVKDLNPGFSVGTINHEMVVGGSFTVIYFTPTYTAPLEWRHGGIQMDTFRQLRRSIQI